MTTDLDDLARQAVNEADVTTPTMNWIESRSDRLRWKRRGSIALPTVPILLLIGAGGWLVTRSGDGAQIIESIDQPGPTDGEQPPDQTTEGERDSDGHQTGTEQAGGQQPGEGNAGQRFDEDNAAVIMPALEGLHMEEAETILAELGLLVEVRQAANSEAGRSDPFHVIRTDLSLEPTSIPGRLL